MLREHLRQWPNDEGADRLRLQLGRLQHGQGRHDEAITTLSAVSADFAGRNEVLSELRDCYARVEDDWVATAQQRSTLAELANRYPDDGPIQEAYARSLAAGDEPELWRGALRQYRIVETRSPEGSPRWFRAKYAIAQLHLRLGDPAKAAKIVRLTQLLHPELGGPAMRDRFEQLLALSQR